MTLAAAAVAVGLALLVGPADAALAEASPAVTVTTQCAESDTNGCVAGTVRDDNGNAIGGAKVTLTGPGGATAEAKTGADGTWAFAVAVAGSYTVVLDVSTLPKGVSASAPSKKLPAVTLGGFPSSANFGIVGHGAGSQSNEVGATSFGEILWQASTQGLLLGLLLALASIGLSLVYGTTGLSNFAHGEQVTFGGLITFVFSIDLGWPFPLAVLASVALGAATGYLQDLVLWAPLRRKGLGVNQLMLVTIGFSFAAQYLFQYFFGDRPVAVANGLALIGGPLQLTGPGYWSMGISIVVLAGIGIALSFTRIGRATRAVADNAPLAAASGIDNSRVIRLVWTVAMGLAALAGAMYAWTNNGVEWSTGGSLLLMMFAAVTLGGIGTAFGALVGSLIIGVVVQITGIWLSGDLKYGTALLVLILILIFRPQGILGRRGRIG